MARAPKQRRTDSRDGTTRRGYWAQEIAKSDRRYSAFCTNGEQVVDRYRLERARSEEALYQDRYNILYSSTETTRPSLYAQTPRVQATQRHKDRENDTAMYATMLIEAVGQYALEEVDFDDVMENVVEDYLLPGLGQAWVRYEPQVVMVKDDAGNEYEDVAFEGIDVDYVYYQDFRTGSGRTWKELPWVARRVYFTKEKARKRFGDAKANDMAYSYNANDDGTAKSYGGGGSEAQAIIWEIWDKNRRKVVWYSEDYGPDVLDEIDDPLHLKDFWPCPRPLRAVKNTRTFIPKSFYSQYKAQAEELDRITERIRHLTKALRVVGVYDASQEKLAQLLSGTENKMVPVENWAAFAQAGGVSGSIQWVPIKEVAAVLTELYRQREIAKAEIYEITGFSDIVRGVSKASETLGAQKIKSDWAGGRLRSLQKEVQRFCRDLIRIITEIAIEQFSPDTLAMYGGFEPPPVTDEEQQAAAQYAMARAQGMQVPQPPPTERQQAIQKYMQVVQLLKDEKQRCALVGVETDSTIQPDEAQERQDRMEFLGQIGAFLQQAGPMALQYPDMRGLLGSIMMFVVRTFRSSRPIEQEFEEFQKKLEGAPPMPPPGSEGDNPESAKATADGAVQQETIKAQVQQQADAAKAAGDKYKVDTDAQVEREKIASNERIRMMELNLKRMELEIKQAELGIKRDQANVQAATAQATEERADAELAHRTAMDARGAEQQDRQIDVAEKSAAQRAQPRPKGD